MRFFEDHFPRKAKIYVLSVIIAGGLTLLYSAYHCLTQTDYRWLYLASLTVFSSFFAVMIPSREGKVQSLTITASDIFIFSAILLFGPETAVMICTIDGLLGSLRARIKRFYKQLFNLTQLSLVTYWVARIFYALQDDPPPLDPSRVSIPTFLVHMGLCSFIYFVLNSGAVALAISLVTNQPLVDLWRHNFLWACSTNFAGASAAAIIFLYFDETQFYAVAIALPIVGVIYYTFKINLDRIKQAQAHVEKLDELYHSTIASLAMAIDAKDQCTHGHVQRVQTLALGLAKYCGLTDEKELAGLRAASLLHDIGKLAIPEYILNKPSPLTESEFQKMKVHPAVGADILATVPFPYPVVPFVRYHHEKWDGTGYPEGLQGEQIPMGARILSIADCYDALRSDRPYRPQLSREVALDYIKGDAGRAYDTAIVNQLVKHIDELEAEIMSMENRLPQSVIRHIEDSVRAPQEPGPKDIQQTVFHDIASTQREIPAIYEFSRSVGKSLNVTETLTLLSTKIKNLIPYTSCAIYLLNSENDKLLPHHTSGAHSELLDSLELAFGDGVSGWVAANNKTLMNVSPAPDFMSAKLLRSEFKSCLAVPLSMDENVVGVITLYSNIPNAYHHDHLRLMEMVAHHAAAAIKNALIYEETQEDAYTDLLTGLPNSRYFNVFIEQELKRAQKFDYPVTLLMMDLEFFKPVNDTFGHQLGDRLLIQIAHILRNQMRKSDTCVRYGGDEFIGILPGVSTALAQQTILRVQQAVDDHRMMVDSENSIRVGLSIGAATFPEDARDLAELLALADRDMYRNKMARTQGKRQAGTILAFEKNADAR